MKSTMMPVQLSTNQILDRAGTYFGDQEVLGRLPDKSTHSRSYREIRRRARQLAQALRDKAGIGRGDPVATMSWNHAWHLESDFGIPAAGAVLHTLNLRLSPEDISGTSTLATPAAHSSLTVTAPARQTITSHAARRAGMSSMNGSTSASTRNVA